MPAEIVDKEVDKDKEVEETPSDDEKESVGVEQVADADSLRIENKVLKLCAKHNVKDTEIATLLMSKHSLDDVDSEFLKMLKDRPNLVGVKKNLGGPSNPKNSGNKKYTHDDIAKMDLQTINKNWEKISAQMSEGSL